MHHHAAIIFDCDGVLVDSEPIANRVMVELLTLDARLPSDDGAGRHSGGTRFVGRMRKSTREQHCFQLLRGGHNVVSLDVLTSGVSDESFEPLHARHHRSTGHGALGKVVQPPTGVKFNKHRSVIEDGQQMGIGNPASGQSGEKLLGDCGG